MREEYETPSTMTCVYHELLPCNRAPFNKIAWHVESGKSLQKTGKGMVEPLTTLSAILVTWDSQVISGNY
jgi:hypothetical protein